MLRRAHRIHCPACRAKAAFAAMRGLLSMALLSIVFWGAVPEANAQIADQSDSGSGRDPVSGTFAPDGLGIIECVHTGDAFDAEAVITLAGESASERALPVTADSAVSASTANAEERAALVALYEATDGPNWKNNTNWLTDAPLGQWFGVYLHYDTGRVDQVVLWDNGLSGPIPPELDQLVHLRRLTLAHNALKGPIPAELRNLEKMTNFRIDNNVDLCFSSDASLTAWLVEKFEISLFPCERSTARVLPSALMREDSHGLALDLGGDLSAPTAVTVSDPSVVAARAVNGWLELTPKGVGSAEVKVVPPDGGEPATAAVKVRRAVGTFGIDMALEQPAPIGYENALVAAADWWSSLLDGTEWPDRSFENTCSFETHVKGFVDDMLIYASFYTNEGRGATGWARLCTRTNRTALPIGGDLGMAVTMGGSHHIIAHEIGHHLGLVGIHPPSLLSADDLYIISPRAVAAYRNLGGDASLPGVPTRGDVGHWDIYVEEWIMGGGNDISIALGHLEDGGYDVNTDAGFPLIGPVVQVTLSASPSALPEGGDVTVTATLSHALSRTVTIPIALTSGTAEKGDYDVSLASIEIPRRHKSGVGAISTMTDDDMDDETFTVAFGVLPANAKTGVASVEVTIEDVTVASAEDEVPLTFALAQNYPNPFNPSTTITYALDRSGPVELSVYDLLGRVVQTLVDGVQPAGRHEVRFDAGDLPTGTYAYRLRAGAETRTRTMVLTR